MLEKRVYIVRGADTLWGIARDQLGDPNKYKDIRRWNGLAGFTLRSGQKLKLYDPELYGERIIPEPLFYDADYIEIDDEEPTYDE